MYWMEKKKKEQINSPEHNRRPDIFMCRKHKVADTTDFSNMLEEKCNRRIKTTDCYDWKKTIPTN